MNRWKLACLKSPDSDWNYYRDKSLAFTGEALAFSRMQAGGEIRKARRPVRFHFARIGHIVGERPNMPRFSKPIYKLGINPVVDPPDNVMGAIFVQAGKSTGPIPVRGSLNGAEFVQTLVRYRGAWRLYINGPMLKDSGLNVGDVADVEIEFDPRPRDVPIPEALATAFRDNAEAKTAFDRLTPSRQKEILKYIGSLKSEDAITRNVERVLKQLRQG